MPDKIVKEIETRISTVDNSEAGIASFEDRVKKMADDVPNYITGKSGGDQKSLDRMRDYYQKLEDIEAKAQIPKDAGIFAGAREVDTSAASAAGEKLGRASGESAARTFSEEFGRGNPLAQTFRILAGGGALLAVDRLAKGIGEAADKSRELYDNFKKGEISGGEFVGDLARSIPLLGDMTKMFDSIGKAARDFVGLPSAADKEEERLIKNEEHRKDIESQEKLTNDVYEKRKRILDEINKSSIALSDEAKVAGLGGLQKEFQENSDKFDDTIRRIQDQESKLGALSPDQQTEAKNKLAKDRIAALKIYEAEAKRIQTESGKQEDEEKRKQDEFTDHMMELQKRLADKQAEGIAEQQRKQDEAAKHQVDVAKELQDMRIDELKASGGISQNDAKRLEVAERYLDKQKELQKIVNDPSATAAQRGEAKSLLGGLGAAEAAAERDAVRVARRGTASSQGAGQLTGLVDQANTRAADPAIETAASAKVSAEKITKVATLLEQIHSLLSPMAGSNVATLKAV